MSGKILVFELSKCCQPIKLLDSFKCNISEKWMIKCIFIMQTNIEVFYKLILSFWVCVVRHSQSTQNKKFAYLCKISRKALWVKLIFLPANKHKSFLWVDSITLGLCSQACPKYPKQVYSIFVISQGKCGGWTWSFACR